MIDLDRLLRLRLIVARHGEMDRARWWNTEGMLGPTGSFALRRGLPRTHRFAQARIVFAVAAARCQELYGPVDAFTLWRLPADLEDQFERRWPEWLASQRDWEDLFASLASEGAPDLLAQLTSAGPIAKEDAARVEDLELTAEGRAVRVPDADVLNDDVVGQLAAGFSRGAQGQLVVPHVKVAA